VLSCKVLIPWHRVDGPDRILICMLLCPLQVVESQINPLKWPPSVDSDGKKEKPPAKEGEVIRKSQAKKVESFTVDCYQCHPAT
jgi:hypothetical protein